MYVAIENVVIKTQLKPIFSLESTIAMTIKIRSELPSESLTMKHLMLKAKQRL